MLESDLYLLFSRMNIVTGEAGPALSLSCRGSSSIF